MRLDARAIYESRTTDERGTSLGLLIPTEEQYVERLRIAASLALEADIRASVVDLGCGYADLADWLQVDTNYLGIEMVPWIYREARQRHPDLSLIRAPIQSIYAEQGWDVVVMLGVLATTTPGEWPELAAHVKNMARKAVVISWLSADSYRGSLICSWDQDVTRLFGRPDQVVAIEGDATKTAIFPVP
jgi:hypothetical protein